MNELDFWLTWNAVGDLGNRDVFFQRSCSQLREETFTRSLP